jgi:cytosine/adenosine deaminase-related metal-dependent hydrolase
MSRLLLCGDYVVEDCEQAPLPNSAVLIDGAKVAAVGPAERLKNEHPDARVLGGPGRIVLPGFIDAHQHGRGITNIQRGVTDGFLEQWLVRLRGLWPLDPYLATMAAGIRLLKSGVTTALHHFASVGILPAREEMVACMQAYKDVGLRVTFSFDFRDRHSYVYADDHAFLATLEKGLAAEILKRLPPRVLPSPASSRSLVREIQAEYESPLTRFAIGPQGADWSSDKALSELRELASDTGLPFHTHMLETRLQREASLREHGKTPVERLADFGLLSEQTSLAHMVWADDADLDLVLKHKAIIVHNPASNLRLRSGLAPLTAILERGIPVGIGMDGMSMSDRGDYFEDLRLCRSLHFTPSGDGLQAEQIWSMVYEGGRVATFWGDKIGALRPGAHGDAVVFNMVSSPLIAPLDPQWNLLHRVLREGAMDRIETVVVGGRPVMEGGAITVVDEDAIYGRITEQSGAIDRSALRNHRALVAQLEAAVVDFYRSWPRDEALNCKHLH